jgi:hypothetical protein
MTTVLAAAMSFYCGGVFVSAFNEEEDART